MNRLIECVKTSIDIDGITYNINTDFRSALWTWMAFYAYDAGEISANSYIYALVHNMYTDPRPDIFNEKALIFASEYLNAFSDKNGERKSKIPPVDIEQDSAMIFSAYLAMGINLRSCNMDYEEFLSRMQNIPENCEYSRVMYLRHMWYEKRSKMTKDDKEACARIGWDKIKVRERKKETETENSEAFDEFMRLFNS